MCWASMVTFPLMGVVMEYTRKGCACVAYGLGLHAMMLPSETSAKCAPSTGYSTVSSYAPLRSSVTFALIASESTPTPSVVKAVASSGKSLSAAVTPPKESTIVVSPPHW